MGAKRFMLTTVCSRSVCCPALADAGNQHLILCKDRCRVQKHGPVFMSNLYGTKTVVVADFVGWEKVRRCDDVQFH